MENIPEPRLDPPAPAVFCTCEDCGEGIYIGEDYYEVQGWRYCRYCMEHYHRKEANYDDLRN